MLAKAQDLGVPNAKTPSSSLDKITAEFVENELVKELSGGSALSSSTHMGETHTGIESGPVLIRATPLGGSDDTVESDDDHADQESDTAEDSAVTSKPVRQSPVDEPDPTVEPEDEAEVDLKTDRDQRPSTEESGEPQVGISESPSAPTALSGQVSAIRLDSSTSPQDPVDHGRKKGKRKRKNLVHPTRVRKTPAQARPPGSTIHNPASDHQRKASARRGRDRDRGRDTDPVQARDKDNGRSISPTPKVAHKDNGLRTRDKPVHRASIPAPVREDREVKEIRVVSREVGIPRIVHRSISKAREIADGSIARAVANKGISSVIAMIGTGPGGSSGETGRQSQ
ncbi:MAG: hypothetical protein LR011_11190 [Verrucomicrobia bacterium]|nr:hypothetical protein [Verrucomicrobiota bacterium]